MKVPLIASSLLGLFIDDGAQALSILGIVGVCVVLHTAGAGGNVTGAALLIGTIAVLLESVMRAVRRPK